MSPPIRRKPQTEQRREDLVRIDQMSVKVTRVCGRVLIVGSGEVTVQLPIFTFGGELDEGFSPTEQDFPTISAVVVGWTRVKAIENVTPGYYKSANVAVVSTGPDDHQIWLHYSFEAKAMRNPITSDQSLEDPL
jgi:hypothetical protein